MKDTLNELEQSLIQGGYYGPKLEDLINTGTIYDPTQDGSWPAKLLDYKKLLIIH
jgi:hypothetical protein